MPQLPETPLPLKDRKDFLVLLFMASVVFSVVETFLGKLCPESRKLVASYSKVSKDYFTEGKTQPLFKTARSFAASKRFAIGRLYKFARFKGLHMGRSSLLHYTTQSNGTKPDFG